MTPTAPAFGPELADEFARVARELASAFHRGATMWCISPRWPHHARHIAVEFVHPVIVGKPALPAVAVTGDDPVGQLRALVRTGDVVVVVTDGTEPELRGIDVRADAWGATLVVVGVGPPASAIRGRCLVLDHEDGLAAWDGRAILAYHLLWELSHVCLEQPGALLPARTGPETDVDCVDDVCITCSDEGVPGEVVTSDGDTTTVRTHRGRQTIDTSLVDEVRLGDLVLVHGGVAIARIGGDDV